MDPANEETGREPRPQPPPFASHPSTPASSASHTSDPDRPLSQAEPSEDSASPSPASAQSSRLPSHERPVSGIVPPYWSHHRNASRTSQYSVDGGPAITLEDHTEDPNSETSRGLWAKSVTVDDHVVVQGKTGIGAYVVWNCKIRTLEGGTITVRMRYSEFDDLRHKLVKSFPHAKNALPALPPKSVVSGISTRRSTNKHLSSCVLLNPEFSSSPIVKDILFERMC
ncbi:hypothetical protein BDW69DRAFT_191343 [Aspergillus filifer]